MKPRIRNISDRELSHLIIFISRMVTAGVSTQGLTKALRNMAGSEGLRVANERIVTTIENGGSLSEGMARSPGSFAPLYVSLIQAGELSGRLPEALTRVQSHLHREQALRRKIKAALIYPLCVVSTAALVSSLLVIFIIPSFTELFADLGTPLPWITRVVIVISETSLRCAPAFLLIISLLCFMVSRFLTTVQGRELWDRCLLTIPLIGDIVKKSALTRLCQTFSTTLDAGMPIVSALETSAWAAGNRCIQQRFAKALVDIAEGSSISHSLNTTKLFPSTSIEMLELGERTGSIVTMLENISGYLEEEFSRSLDTIIQMVEPTLIAIVGGIVGTLVIALYLPILSMGELFT